MPRVFKNWLTLAVMGLPVGLAIMAFSRPEPGSLTVYLVEADVVVKVAEQSFYADTMKLGPLELAAGEHELKVVKGNDVLFNRTVTLHSGAKQVIHADWDRAAASPAAEKEARRFEGHRAGITGVAFSPDGRRALSGSRDWTVRLWDLGTGSELRRFEGHSMEVTGVAFSPDGLRALSCSKDSTIRLWEVESGRELLRLEGKMKWVHAVAFSPDGRRALSCSDDRTLRLWDLETGKELSRVEGEGFAAGCVTFSPDGRHALAGMISTAGTPRTIRCWDLTNAEPVRWLEGHRLPVWSTAFSPDGRLALSGGSDRTVRLWDVESGRELRRFEGSEGVVQSVAFAPDGRRALTGGGARWSDGWFPASDYRMRLWDVESGRELQHFNHSEPVESVAFAPDGRWALSGSDDGVLRLWDLSWTALGIRSDADALPIHSLGPTTM